MLAMERVTQKRNAHTPSAVLIEDLHDRDLTPNYLDRQRHSPTRHQQLLI
jgi:hypothetical protein